MNRVRAFFIEEATECLEAARRELTAPTPDAARLLSAARRLRGSAQLARFGGLAREAGVLEDRLRRQLKASGEQSDTGVSKSEMGGTLAALEQSLRAVRLGEIEQDTEPENLMDGEAVAGSDGVVEIEELEYRGRAALDRALQLREALEDAVVTDQPVGPILDELFDLVRLGMR